MNCFDINGIVSSLESVCRFSIHQRLESANKYGEYGYPIYARSWFGKKMEGELGKCRIKICQTTKCSLLIKHRCKTL